MTVASELNRKTFAGDDATTSFATSPVVFFETEDLTVYVVINATDVAAQLTEGVDYTVSGGDGSTGTVNLAGGSDPHGALFSGTTLVIVRDVPITQAVDFVNNDNSDAEVLEDALDKSTMILQQLDARVQRSAALADSDITGADVTLPTPAARQLIGWDDDGLALINYLASDFDVDILVSAFAETQLDDADADEAFQTIVTGATAETAPAAGDLIMLSDVSLTPDDGRKMTLANVFKVINDFTAEATIALDDLLAVYDTSGGSTDKMTPENFLKVLNLLTEDTAPDTATDYLLSYDASASTVKRVKPHNLKGTRVLAKSGAAVSGAADTNENTLATITVPAGALGANGQLRVRAHFTQTNSGNNKTYRFRFSGAAGTVLATTVSGAADFNTFDFAIANQNATNAQRSFGHGAYNADTPVVADGTNTTAAIDTTAQTTLVITGQKASAGETITLQAYTVEIVTDGT